MTATATLNNGKKIPLVGLGCWMSAPADAEANEATERMVASALKLGYKHFDTASGYANEKAVGKAIRASGIPREELFVTTKLTGSDHGRVAEAFEKSLAELDIEYIDLFLVHWPQATDPATKKVVPFGESPTLGENWAAMEALLATGKVKSIGVSNYSVKNLEILLKTAKVVPAVNQIEAHPFLPQDDVVAFGASKGIHTTAYCPLGQYNSPILEEEVVKKAAEKYGKTAGQVLLSWGVQRGVSVVPKSATPSRQAENLATFNLDEEDFKAISEVHKTPGNYRSLCSYSGNPGPDGVLYGWRIKEDLGWDFDLTIPQ